jgi:hypothetical protein
MQAATFIEAWETPPDARHACDPLLACLVHITGLLGKPGSPDALSAGLPIPEGGLTPELFVRAAERVGLSAKIVRRSLDQISSLVLPAVLLLNDKEACVLVAKDDAAQVQLLMPDATGVYSPTAAELGSRYSGYAIFVRPRLKLDERSEQSATAQQKHWFWSAIAQCWPIYAEVLIASLLINLFALVTPFFTMNVYDRVVPNLAIETLWVLTIGAAIVFGFDLLMRTLRSYFIDVAGKRVDVILSINLFGKVLGIRMADRPPSVGAFASNVQEFESLREFVTSATITTVVDLPFALLFVLAMAWPGGPAPVVSRNTGKLSTLGAAASDARRNAGGTGDYQDSAGGRACATAVGTSGWANREARPAHAIPFQHGDQLLDFRAAAGIRHGRRRRRASDRRGATHRWRTNRLHIACRTSARPVIANSWAADALSPRANCALFD